MPCRTLDYKDEQKKFSLFHGIDESYNTKCKEGLESGKMIKGGAFYEVGLELEVSVGWVG